MPSFRRKGVHKGALNLPPPTKKENIKGGKKSNQRYEYSLVDLGGGGGGGICLNHYFAKNVHLVLFP